MEIDLWLPDVAKDWMKKWVKPDMRGVEFGSGCSTLWLGQRVRSLVSVESDREWYERVKEWLKQYNIKNVELIYAPNKEKYLGVLDRFEDRHFDFAFSDGPGNLRSPCIRASWPKVKVGGALIADNTESPHSTGGKRFLEKQGVRRKSLRGPVTNPWNGRRNEVGVETSVWIKEG